MAMRETPHPQYSAGDLPKGLITPTKSEKMSRAEG